MREPTHDHSGAEAGTAIQDIGPREVFEYLTRHPDFLVQHPELAAGLTPPPLIEGEKVVDLQTYLVGRLRGQVGRLKERERTFLEATRANHNTQGRIHAAILFLLDSESFEHLIETISTDLAVLLDLDATRLVVESDGIVGGADHVSAAVRMVPPGAVDKLLAFQDIVLEGNAAPDEAIWGPATGLVKSQALIRLNVTSDTPPCMLALGSRDAEMFHPGMRTELIAFLGRVLERCIRSWLKRRD